MPKYTAKQHLINKYEREFTDAAIAIVQTPKERRLVRLRMLEATVEILKFLHGNRYVHPRTQVPSSTDLRDRVLNAYNDVRFKGIMRLTKDQFQRIALILSRSGHFKRGGEHVPLEDIIIQLKVALLRLGSEGISVLMTAWVTDVSVGLVTAYTWRCINALDELFQRCRVARQCAQGCNQGLV
ncbi:hypothetical protein BC939DRAFT_460012 [Gamsiella multidivaricata]|uniref:uncharacterized protein n=1 Tax=Gamsiella multidivaricata TaxID=101098 RepID=UPI00221F7F93|nr:uncharacterized protein BC939DRAFT_460012 [Gamsiella multidivaricata]KAI7819523.1 hypothetical protein BC939DRAFT_460012 [Gamsiella multidivaricata]